MLSYLPKRYLRRRFRRFPPRCDLLKFTQSPRQLHVLNRRGDRGHDRRRADCSCRRSPRVFNMLRVGLYPDKTRRCVQHTLQLVSTLPLLLEPSSATVVKPRRHEGNVITSCKLAKLIETRRTDAGYVLLGAQIRDCYTKQANIAGSNLSTPSR